MNVSGQENWMDKLFSKKLSNFEVSPEDHVWDAIAKKLDESQKRPGLFGSWWTVILSIIILLLVTSAGAYMLYKNFYHQKAEKSQNKDLPYIEKNNDQKGTADINSSIESTLETTQTPLVNLSRIQKNENSTRTSVLQKDKENAITHIAKQSQYLEAQEKVHSTTLNSNEEISDFKDSMNANDLIASIDNEFIRTVGSANKDLVYSYLPLRESYLRKENEQLSSPKIMDGCNVYKDNRTNFFLDVYYAPEIASRSLKTDNPALQSYVEKRANSEKPMLSYSLGVKASFVFGNGLAIRSGLSYSNNTERFDFIKETQTIKKEIFDNQGNLIRTEYTEVVIMDKVYNSYKFLDIPILVGYEKELKDFMLSLNGGIGINVFSTQSGKIYKDVTNTKSFYLLENNGEANDPIFRTNAGVSLIGSVGLNYKYNERIMLLFEPSARYYLNSLSDPSNPISQNYLFLGMNIGLRYRIK